MSHDSIKYATDGAAVGVWLGALLNQLPAIAAILSIIWTVIRIYETKTVQRWLGRDGVNSDGD